MLAGASSTGDCCPSGNVVFQRVLKHGQRYQHLAWSSCRLPVRICQAGMSNGTKFMLNG